MMTALREVDTNHKVRLKILCNVVRSPSLPNLIRSSTRKRRRATMLEKPITASHVRVSPMCSKTAFQVWTNPSALNFNPSKDLTWVVAMVKAAAVVKPAITGAAINSMRKPKLRRPKSNEMHPVKKANNVAAPGPIRTAESCVMRARRAVGPIVTTRVLPKTK